MIRSIIVFVLLVSTLFFSVAQDKEKKSKTADLPGMFVVDFGFSTGVHAPENFKEGTLGSRTVNIYYQYPIRFGRSKFSFTPGIGLGLDRFKLTNKYTLSSSPTTDGNYELVNADIATRFPGVKKSMIITNYLDIPIEFRFDTHPEDISRSFNVALGARAGILFDAHTKVKYKQGSENKVIKDKQNHGLNNFRYGFYGRIGVGRFNAFMFYNRSPFFKSGKGPDRTKMNTVTAGISLNGL